MKKKLEKKQISKGVKNPAEEFDFLSLGGVLHHRATKGLSADEIIAQEHLAVIEAVSEKVSKKLGPSS